MRLQHPGTPPTSRAADRCVPRLLAPAPCHRKSPRNKLLRETTPSYQSSPAASAPTLLLLLLLRPPPAPRPARPSRPRAAPPRCAPAELTVPPFPPPPKLRRRGRAFKFAPGMEDGSCCRSAKLGFIFAGRELSLPLSRAVPAGRALTHPGGSPCPGPAPCSARRGALVCTERVMCVRHGIFSSMTWRKKEGPPPAPKPGGQEERDEWEVTARSPPAPGSGRNPPPFRQSRH